MLPAATGRVPSAHRTDLDQRHGQRSLCFFGASEDWDKWTEPGAATGGTDLDCNAALPMKVPRRRRAANDGSGCAPHALLRN